MSSDAAKKRAAEKALEFVKPNMTLGIGTGSTANFFIDALAEKIAAGWDLRGVPSSVASAQRALAAGVELIEPDETTIIDLAVDGADEVDPALNLIKGGGAALLREKIIADAAQQFIVIADKSKRVVAFGAFPLPIEIEPFGWALTVKRIRNILAANGFGSADISLRASSGAPTRTDGGNFILDCALTRIEAPGDLDNALRAIPGVIETGLFCSMADMAIFGDEDSFSIDRP